MLYETFSLAVQKVIHRRNVSVLVFAIFLCSFSCAIMSLSLTQSMSYTNTEYRLNTFGEWYIALPYTKDGDAEWFRAQSWVEEIGTATVYSDLLQDTLSGSFGTVDSTYLDIGRVHLLDGRLPKADNEVAVEERVLRELGYSKYEIGQDIYIPGTAMSDGQGISVSAKYTLCGVLADYSELWGLFYNVQDKSPVCTIMTSGGAQALLDKANAALQRNHPGSEPVKATKQLYVCVQRDQRRQAAQDTEAYLAETRDAETEDIKPCVNYAAYPDASGSVTSDEIYSFLIAAVALVAVLCVYLMNLPAEVHSFAVLRSVGITKGQLLLLMLFESLLLAVPSVLLGVPLGAGLTWLALRLLVYSGSVAIQVVVPYGMLKTLFVLWLVAILLARLVIFLIVVHTPLTGRMQMQERKARRASFVRRVMVMLLLTVFGVVVVYAAAQSLIPQWEYSNSASRPDYQFSGHNSSPEFAEKLSQVEGVASVEGFMMLSNGLQKASPVSISFEGMEERGTNLIMVDPDYWDMVYHFGDDLEAFQNGELIYLCFGTRYIKANADGTQSMERYEWENPPLPEGSVTVYAYQGKRLLAQVEAEPRIRTAEELTSMMRMMPVVPNTPYTIVCSEAFVQRLLAEMEVGSVWGSTTWEGTAGEAFTYQSLLITMSENAADLSAAFAVRALLQSEFGRVQGLESNSEEKQAGMQAATQELILLYACGGCVAVVTLLLLASALALEAEQERRSYSILRVIGMSKRQMRKKVFGKALWRSVFAIVAGWMLYAVLCIRVQLALNEYTLSEAVERAWSSFTYYGGGLSFVALLSAAMLAVLLAVSLLAKRGLKQTTLLK